MSREAKEYFEEVSGSWDVLRKGFYGDEVRDAVLTAARLLPEHTVLDVGAGTGFLTDGAAKIVRKVIALDFSDAMMGEARAKLGGRNVEFKIGDVEQMPLPNASIDRVIGNTVLHHCPSRGSCEGDGKGLGARRKTGAVGSPGAQLRIAAEGACRSLVGL